MSYPEQKTDTGRAVTSTKVMTNGDTLFTISGGAILIVGLTSYCVTTGTPAASTVQYNFVPLVGAAATFSGASASLISAVAGSSLLVADGQTTAPTFVVSGANNQNTYPIGIFCPPGDIRIIVGTGPTTGTWHHHLLYRALENSVYITAS